MNHDHLTDETLQAFLLKEMQDNTIAEHLTVCPTCSEKLEDYQRVIVGISKVAPVTFSFDVTAVVMDKIIFYEKKKNKKQEFLFWVLLTFFLVVITSLSIPFIPKILPLFYSTSIFTTLLVTATGVVIFLFLLADIHRQYQTKEEKIVKHNLQPIR